MGVKTKAFKAAFPHTIPVMAGYAFLGLAYGLFITSMGFSFWYPMLLSIIIFAGSMQFVMVNLLVTGFNPISAFTLTLMVNARHLFYGISMLDRFKDVGFKRWYLMFGLTDETFAITYSAKVPEGVDKGWFMFFITLLDHSYWVTASTAGGILGSLITINTKGIDFVMTALFVTIFAEQWFSQKNHLPAICGIAASVVCLAVFGAQHFIIPAMLLIIALLTGFKPLLDKQTRDRLPEPELTTDTASEPELTQNAKGGGESL